MKYDTRCYFDVRSKVDISQLNLLRRTKKVEKIKLKIKTDTLSSSLSRNNLRVVSREEAPLTGLGEMSGVCD